MLLVELQDRPAAPVERERFLADVEPGVALVGDLVGARQGQAQPAEIVDSRDAFCSSCSPNTRAKTRSTALKW
jgi:hypothetical protein